ncbi:MAG TPA: hypothetical protein VG167_05015 [Verrucomicrobiae bacterium]|nr:hypothetical protein [Verrucomicrobiae bacterium]
MKIHWLSKGLSIAFSALALLVCTTGIHAQTSPSDHGYMAAERGHEYTVWSKWVWQTNQGIATVESNTLVQVASGLNRWQSSQWVPAAPELVVTNGGVLGRGAQAAAFFSGNLNSIAATRVHMPDGQWLKTHIVGLAYHDASSNTNLLVAAPKDCAPQIVGTNRVAYLDAFDDLRCDVVYSYTALGVRQDIVLRENPGDPAILYGLNAQSTYLLVISEVDEGPAPQITERAWPAGEDVLVDQTLNFGSMGMVPGRAFRVEHTSGDLCGLLVAKRLETVAGRRFIVERVRYERIEPDLRTLPTSATPLTNAPGITLTNGSIRKPMRWYASGALPPARTSVSGISGRPLKVANVDNRPGVVLDWNLALNPGDFAFTCGNYVVSGETRLADVAFSPNAVLKYDLGASLHVDGALTWSEGPDCGDAPALLTSANDDAHGVVLDWSTHSPTRGDYGPALVVRAQDLPLARLHITNLFGAPGIIAERPAPSSVTIIALKPAARRRAGDSAAVAVRRVDGDWSQPLTVPFTVSGSAVLGQDYQPIGTNVTIPAGEGSTILSVFPTATAEAQPLATVTVALQPDPQEAYVLGAQTSQTLALVESGSLPLPTLINLDFVPQNYNPNSYKVGFAATGQTASDFWNALSCPNQYGASLANLVAADFSATTVGLTVNNCPGTWAQNSPDPMYAGYMYPSYGQTGTLTFNNLRAGRYNVYLYGYDGNYDLAVGSTSYGNHRNRDWPIMSPLVWTEGKQYSRFSNVTLASGQNLVVTLRPGSDGWAVIAGLQVALIPDLVSIATQPANQTVMEGFTATFNVGLSGFGPVSYQWTVGGQDIPGATTSTYTTEPLDMSASGRVYAARITNPAGAVTTTGATLTVLQCDPSSNPLGAVGWVFSCEDKFYIQVSNLTDHNLTGGQFDLYVYFDGVNRSFLRTLLPWSPTDVLPQGKARIFTFCSPDHSITNVDCAVFYRGGGSCAASQKFRIQNLDKVALVVHNTTLVLDRPSLCDQTGPNLVVPYERPACWYADRNCACDGWPTPLPTHSGGGSAVLDNFYQASSPAEHVNVGCPKKGFKNVYAMKQWHGVFGPMSDMLGTTYSSMKGDCPCQTPSLPVNAVDDTKYLQMHAAAHFEDHYLYFGGSGVIDWPESGQVERDCVVDRLSGKRTYAGSDMGDSAGAAFKAIRDVRLPDLPGIYCGKVSQYRSRLLGLPGPDHPVDFSPVFTDGPVPAMDWDYTWSFTVGDTTRSGHTKGFVKLDLAAGTYSCHYDYYSEQSSESPGMDPQVTWEAVTENEEINLSSASVAFSGDWSNTSSAIVEDTWGSQGGSVTYGHAYTVAQLNADIDGLLTTWDLLDDVQYPWRDDGSVSSGPLVTYNERGATPPSIGFNMINYGDEQNPNWGPPIDDFTPPWPTQPAGAILGAPLQVHGLNGEIYSNEAYFNFYHLNYHFENSGVGDPQAFIRSYGASSPFPNATQWTDADQARIFPAGPFWAYGCGEHFGFWLKNPYITDTGGEWEQGGYWGLVKCKWAETIGSAIPPGKDFVFKDWTFNFRDFIQTYLWNANAWYRNNIDTGCPGMGTESPVRFTPIDIPMGQPGGGYYIGPGSWWVSDMATTPLHYSYDCCQPAIYVQPNAPGPDCSSGVFAPMPPAVCDQRYGSLWMGRVEQQTSDAHACDNYVANRNAGVANSPTCDPQIQLDLRWHEKSNGYEVFYAPLGLDFGGIPPERLTLDLDIDSDNNNSFDPPGRTEAEDRVEDITPGKVLWIHDGDSDGDGIPDYVDGFDLDNSNPEDDVSPYDRFVPLVIELPEHFDLASGNVLISYSASDPSQVWFDSSSSTCVLPPGALRIWRKDGNFPRNKNGASGLDSLGNPVPAGDYVAPGSYSDLSKLGFSPTVRIVTLYVEGVRSSTVLGDQTVTVIYSDARGSASDFVRVTVDLPLDSNIEPHDPRDTADPYTELTYSVSADEAETYLQASYFVQVGQDRDANPIMQPVGDGSVVKWQIMDGSAVGTLSSQETITQDGFTWVKLTTSQHPGNLYKIQAKLKKIVCQNVNGFEKPGGQAFHTNESAVIEVVPGRTRQFTANVTGGSTMPADGKSTKLITATMRDARGELIAQGTDVYWHLKGLGVLADAQDTIDTNGEATARLIAGTVAGNQDIEVEADGQTYTVSVQNTPIDIGLETSGPNVDMAIGGCTTLTATLPGVADGAGVEWSSTKGNVSSAASTVQNGQTAITLHADGTTRTGDALVTASLGGNVKTIRVPFVSSAPISCSASRPTIAGDATSDGTVAVPRLDGTTEQVPFSTSSDVTLRAPSYPRERAHVVFGELLPAQLVHFDFESVTDSRTWDDSGHFAASLAGATLNPGFAYSGFNSLGFDGVSSASIPNQPTFQLQRDFGITVYVNLFTYGGALVAKPGEYSLSVDEVGRPVFSVTTDAGTFTASSSQLLPLYQWTEVEARLGSDGTLTVSVGGWQDRATFTGEPQASASGITLGAGFAGNLDSLSFTRGTVFHIVQDPPWTVTGLDASGNVTLDSQGSATISMHGAGAMNPANPHGHRVSAQISITPTATPDMTATETAQEVVQVVPKSEYAIITAMAGGISVTTGGATQPLTDFEREELVSRHLANFLITGQRSAAVLPMHAGSLTANSEVGFRVAIWLEETTVEASRVNRLMVSVLNGVPEDAANQLNNQLSELMKHAAAQGRDSSFQQFFQENAGQLVSGLYELSQENGAYLKALATALDGQETWTNASQVAQTYGGNLVQELGEIAGQEQLPRTFLQRSLDWLVKHLPSNPLTPWQKKSFNTGGDMLRQHLNQGVTEGTVDPQFSYCAGYLWGLVRLLNQNQGLATDPMEGIKVGAELVSTVVNAISGDEQAKQALLEMVPVYGTYRSFDGSLNDWENGSYFDSGIGSFQGTLGAVGDVTLVSGVAIKSARVLTKLNKSLDLVRNWTSPRMCPPNHLVDSKATDWAVRRFERRGYEVVPLTNPSNQGIDYLVVKRLPSGELRYIFAENKGHWLTGPPVLTGAQPSRRNFVLSRLDNMMGNLDHMWDPAKLDPRMLELAREARDAILQGKPIHGIVVNVNYSLSWLPGPRGEVYWWPRDPAVKPWHPGNAY